MHHPFYAASRGYALLRIAAVTARILLSIIGLVAGAFSLFLFIAALVNASFWLLASFALCLVLYRIGFWAFQWDHHTAVNNLARRNLARRNRQALIGA